MIIDGLHKNMKTFTKEISFKNIFITEYVFDLKT